MDSNVKKVSTDVILQIHMDVLFSINVKGKINSIAQGKDFSIAKTKLEINTFKINRC